MNGLHHTNRGRRQLLAAAVFFSSLFGFGWAAYRFKPIWPPLGTASRLAQPPATLPDFVSLAKRFDPSLVHIATLDTRPLHGLDDSASDSAPHRPGARGSLGAGIIIHRDGHIVTNDHIVAHAEKIFVKLANRRELDATVVGRDTRSDIALIKVAAPHALTAASLGDSSLLQTGEWVVAMGSPFGLDRTLTAGIVSATTRRIAAAAYYDYIQTDVSINPGNSGGPLLNLQGRVVGVNTAMFSRNGDNTGISFALPINLVKELLPELLSKGRVSRGWLGISTQTMNRAMAELLRLNGALVVGVAPHGPAAQAGIQAGDVVVGYDGKTVSEAGELPDLVAKTAVGRRVALWISRHGIIYRALIAVGELKDSDEHDARATSSRQNRKAQTRHLDAADFHS